MSKRSKALLSKASLEFEEWILRGPGEGMLGGAIKARAASERRRLERKLETPNLFQHIEHEDRTALDKAKHSSRVGDRMVKRCRARTKAISEIERAEAGLQITADDLSIYRT